MNLETLERVLEAILEVCKFPKEPMNCIAIFETMQVKGLWCTPGGAKPEATLYASILREING